MKIKQFMRIHGITDLGDYFGTNMRLGLSPVAMYACPKCEDILSDSSDITTHVCTPDTKVEHTWYKCTCEQAGCMFCDGGLGACTVCGGFEGTLSTECCEKKLNKFILEAIYHGGLDYINGQWIVKDLIK